MRCYLMLIVGLLLFCTKTDAQSPSVIFSNETLSTAPYYNEIVTYENGFFALFTTNETKSNLIITKFDECFNELWTKRYKSSYDLDLQQAIIEEDELTVLFVTHFGSSLTRTPVILNLNLEGDVLSSYRYFSEEFDNFINLSWHNNQYHIFGPTSMENLKGGGHFAIDNSGEIIYANVLNHKNNKPGVQFGCTVLDNGIIIRRHNNSLIACNKDQNIIWARRFMEHNVYALSESTPVVLEDGFVQFLRVQDSIVLFKMDFWGNIIWSKNAMGKHIYSSPVLMNNKICFIWKNQIAANTDRFTYTELDVSDGNVVENRMIDGTDVNNIAWPDLHVNSNEDIFITGNVENDDVILVNPLNSDCLDNSEANQFEDYEIALEDVADEYEIIKIDAFKEKVNFKVEQIESFLVDQCHSVESIELDEHLDCTNTFIFDGTKYGSKFNWSDGRKDSIRKFTEPQTISVFIENCAGKYEYELNISKGDCPCHFYAPNIISQYSTSPENSKFKIYSDCQFNYYSVAVYDRWGNLIHQSMNAEDYWKPNSQKISQGVYIWILQFKKENSPLLQTRTGTVMYVK